jgi:ADP-ribose pyrophosphatase YjhB (NUDIX family)
MQTFSSSQGSAGQPAPIFASSLSAGNGFAPASGFGPVVADPYEAYFSQGQARQKIALPGGYVAEPIWCIRRVSDIHSTDEVARANLGNVWWTPKNANGNALHAQRCPYISVDNVCFMYKPGMRVPELVLGIWSKKDIQIHGEKHALYECLALAGGGHYERMGKKSAYLGEAGDMSAQIAADKELKEEIGIDRARGVKIVTHHLGVFDDPLAEPRAHYYRDIYLRWIEQEPRPSAELKTVITLPVDQVEALCNKQTCLHLSSDRKLTLGLGHDKLIALVMSHPDTKDFLKKICLFHETQQQNQHPQQASTGFGGAAWM